MNEPLKSGENCMARRKSKNPSNKWTVKELKTWVSEKSEEVRQQVKDFENLEVKGRAGIFFKKSVKALQQAATGKTRSDNYIPTGNRTKKADLLKQAKELLNFGKRKSTKQVKQNVEIQRIKREDTYVKTEPIKKDNRYLDEDFSEYDRKQKENKEFLDEFNKMMDDDNTYNEYIISHDLDSNLAPPFDDEQKERAYQKFKEHYDSTLSRDDYETMLDVFNALSNYLVSFGYERQHGDTPNEDNITLVGNLLDYVESEETVMNIYWAAREAIDKSKGKQWTPMIIMKELDNIMNRKE